MLSGLGTVVGALAVFYAAHKGSDTFKQWRRQKGEERRIEVAEQILILSYKVKRALESIRSPMMLSGEVAKVEEKLRESGALDESTGEGKKGNLTTAQGALMRMDHYKDLWNSLLDITPVAKAIFGDEIEKQLNELWSQRSKIAVAANSYARLPSHDHARTPEQQAYQTQHRERLEQTLWFGGDESGVDAIEKAVGAAISKMETTLLPTIRSDTAFGTSP